MRTCFDSVAGDYDLEFTESPLGRDLRAIVWNRLAVNFKPGDFILELNCGTGEDAVWMAKKGIRVLATDVSAEMLKSTAQKATANGVAGMIEVRHLDISRPETLPSDLRFDGVLSNFGGLNCVGDLRPVASILGERVVPGGRLVLIYMGRYCAWEIAWHCLHLRPITAFRRLRLKGAAARVGSEMLQVWYPTARPMHRVFEPWFSPRRVTGLGVFLPPTYLAHWISDRPRLYRFLGRIERSLASSFPFTSFGDHTICEFERTGESSRRGQ
jgi:SAM-dependent methyltransferase